VGSEASKLRVISSAQGDPAIPNQIAGSYGDDRSGATSLSDGLALLAAFQRMDVTFYKYSETLIVKRVMVSVPV